MTKTLIASSGTGPESNCGYSGTVPENEEWYTVLTDNAWGAQGEHLVGVGGQTVTVSRCHAAGQYIGIANGQNFHYMRKYAVQDTAYDCINGACTKKNIYNTPGLYPSLSDCEEACGTGCNGKCVSSSDWTQIENLSGQLKSRNCS